MAHKNDSSVHRAQIREVCCPHAVIATWERAIRTKLGDPSSLVSAAGRATEDKTRLIYAYHAIMVPFSLLCPVQRGAERDSHDLIAYDHLHDTIRSAARAAVPSYLRAHVLSEGMALLNAVVILGACRNTPDMITSLSTTAAGTNTSRSSSFKAVPIQSPIHTAAPCLHIIATNNADLSLHQA